MLSTCEHALLPWRHHFQAEILDCRSFTKGLVVWGTEQKARGWGGDPEPWQPLLRFVDAVLKNSVCFPLYPQ